MHASTSARLGFRGHSPISESVIGQCPRNNRNNAVGKGVGATVTLAPPKWNDRVVVRVNDTQTTKPVNIADPKTARLDVQSADDQTGTERITLRYEVPGEVYLSDTLVVTVVGDELQIVPDPDEVCALQPLTVWAYRGLQTVKADWYVTFFDTGRIVVEKNGQWVEPQSGSRALKGKESMRFRGSAVSSVFPDVGIQAKEGGQTATGICKVVEVSFVALEFFDEGPVKYREDKVSWGTRGSLYSGYPPPGIGFIGVARIPRVCEGTLQFVQNINLVRDILFVDGGVLRLTSKGKYLLNVKDPYAEGKSSFLAPDCYKLVSDDTPMQGAVLEVQLDEEQKDLREYVAGIRATDQLRLYFLFKPKTGERFTLGVGTWTWRGEVGRGPDGALALLSKSFPEAPPGTASSLKPVLKPNVAELEFEVLESGVLELADKMKDWYNRLKPEER